MSIQVTIPSPQQRAHDLAITYMSIVANTPMPTGETAIQRCERVYTDAYKRFLALLLNHESNESQNI